MVINKLKKISSGIPGFDEISYGGIPEGRCTLISGTSGAGKTIFSTQFLYKGIIDLKENGVFVTFEEWPMDIIRNMKGFGWDIQRLQKENKWAFVDASPDETANIEIGQYDLAALMARIEYAIKKIGAKRIIIDSMSSIFFHYHDPSIIRRELYRIISMLKKMAVTCLITVERKTEEGEISIFGVEQFVSDNVILLHNCLNNRGKRDRGIEILKFRGSIHDSQEVPLLIDNHGISVCPLPVPKLKAKMSLQKVSMGINSIDEMLCGGVYQNSITLVTGASGTGKTITAIHFIIEGAKKGQKSLLIEFEESPDQLYSNASSLGWNLKKYVDEGIIQIVCKYDERLRPEQYLSMIQDLVIKHKVKRFAIDPLSSLQRIYSEDKFREFIIGLSDFLRMQNITSLFTSISPQTLGGADLSGIGVSTTVDNIIIYRYVELGGRMKKFVNVLKQRGSIHMKELMEFDITNNGIEVVGSFEGVENLISGSARRVRIRFDEEDAEREFIGEHKRGRV